MRFALVLCIGISACHATMQPPPPRPGAPVTFRVPAEIGALVSDATTFALFAAEVRRQLVHADDPHGLFVLAMLDALDEHWGDAVAKLDRIAATERDPGARAMRGLTIRVWADALAKHTSFRDSLAARVDALPGDVAPALAELRAMAVTFTPEVCRKLVVDNVHPRAGVVDLQGAHAIVFQRYAVVRLVPVGNDIDQVLAARGVELPAE